VQVAAEILRQGQGKGRDAGCRSRINGKTDRSKAKSRPVKKERITRSPGVIVLIQIENGKSQDIAGAVHSGNLSVTNGNTAVVGGADVVGCANRIGQFHPQCYLNRCGIAGLVRWPGQNRSRRYPAGIFRVGDKLCPAGNGIRTGPGQLSTRKVYSRASLGGRGPDTLQKVHGLTNQDRDTDLTGVGGAQGDTDV